MVDILFFFSFVILRSTVTKSVLFQENAASEKKVIVAVKQGNMLATAFHPELTADTRWSVCKISYALK